jgi:uncharacterized protein YuzE
MSPQNPTSDADIEAAIQAELPWLLERAKARDAAASEDTVSGKATAMTPFQPSDFLDLIPAMLQAPHRSMHCTYDEPADVMYVNFEPGAEATDSELGPDDIIVRYRGDEVIGLTILHASRRARVNGD